jgi:hypothetical protein
MEAALRSYIDRCRTMTDWWASPAAGAHRADRVRDLAARRHHHAAKRNATSQRKFDEDRAKRSRKRKSPTPNPDSIASRINIRIRKQTDPGAFLSTKSVDEHAAEADQECRMSPGRSPDLPWF